MIIDLDTETESLIATLANKEQTSAAQLIKKALVNYFESTKKTDDDFFACAGMWKDSDINQDNLRAKAWTQGGHGSV